MLSGRQKEELNRAIADYLLTNNYNETFDSFLRETNLTNDESILNDKRNSGVLEKKWTTVVRLQKKIADLEEALNKKDQELLQSVNTTMPGGRENKRSPTEWLPRPPEKFVLAGHKSEFKPLLTVPS